jgi:hypothetical protein
MKKLMSTLTIENPRKTSRIENQMILNLKTPGSSLNEQNFLVHVAVELTFPTNWLTGSIIAVKSQEFRSELLLDLDVSNITGEFMENPVQAILMDREQTFQHLQEL